MSQSYAKPDRTNALTNTARTVVGQASSLSSWGGYNAGASAVFLQIFDALEAGVTLGTTKPALSLPIPPGYQADRQSVRPLRFETGITMALTASQDGADAPSAPLNIFFEWGS